jgi:N-acyl-D-aspartate/D-glutamate deacylase
VGHSALRTHVMGEKAMTDAASPDEISAMKHELADSIRAGAIGLSTSRSRTHRTPDGKPVASRLADWQEVRELAGVMGGLGAGVMEFSRESTDKNPEARRDEQSRMKALALETGVPLTFGSSWYHRDTPDVWRNNFEMVDDTIAAGGKMLIQGTATWNGSLRSFETMMPYDKEPIWAEFRKLPLADQEAGLRDPAMRLRLTDAAKAYKLVPNPAYPNALQRPVDWNWVFPLLQPLPPYHSIAEIAAQQAKDPIDVVIDMALERHLKLFFIQPSNNEDQDYVLACIRHPHSAVTFSDAGAHVATTINPIHGHLLGHWVRNENALPLEQAVRKITSGPRSAGRCTAHQAEIRRHFDDDRQRGNPDAQERAYRRLARPSAARPAGTQSGDLITRTVCDNALGQAGVRAGQILKNTPERPLPDWRAPGRGPSGRVTAARRAAR